MNDYITYLDLYIVLFGCCILSFILGFLSRLYKNSKNDKSNKSM